MATATCKSTVHGPSHPRSFIAGYDYDLSDEEAKVYAYAFDLPAPVQKAAVKKAAVKKTATKKAPGKETR